MPTSSAGKNERLLLSAVFLFWFSIYTYPSFLTNYAVTTLGATKVFAGTIIGSYGFTQMLLRIPLGIFSDVVKRRRLFVQLGFAVAILSGAGFCALSMLVDGQGAPGYLAYGALIFRGMAGVTASTWVTFSVLYSSSYSANEIPAAMGRLTVPQCGSQIVAMLVGAQLAGHFGALYAFLLATAAAVAGLIVVSRVQEQVPTGEPLTVRGFLSVAKDKDLIMGTALAALYQLVAWATVQGFVQNWARDVIGMTTAQLGYLPVANLLPNTVLSLLSGGILSRRFGRRRVLVAGFVFLACACFLYQFARSIPAILLVQALFGSGVGLIMPLTMAGAIQNIPAEKRGAAMGIYQSIYGVGMFIGPVLAGAVIEAFSTSATSMPGYIANFYVAGGIALAGGVAALVMTRGERRNG